MANKETAPVQTLDLSTIEGHARSAEWIRNNVLLSEPQGNAVVQLEVKLRAGTDGKEQKVTLFMDTENAYILAFRGGQGRLYLLNKPGSNEETAKFEQRLRAAGYLDEQESPHYSNLAPDHKNGLKTLEQRFRPDDLIYAGQINAYGDKEAMRSPEDLRRPVGLLVCMLSESARINLMEVQFRKLYFGEVAHPGEPGKVFTFEAAADPAIQCYEKAIRISIWADTHVQHPDRWYRVELLDKRANEMRDLIDTIAETAGDASQRKAMVQKVLDGKFPPNPKIDKDVRRLASLARELGIQDAHLLGAIISACIDRDAVRAAKAGVTLWRGGR